MPPTDSPIVSLAVDRDTGARMIGICTRSLDALIAAGQIPAIKLNPSTIQRKNGTSYQRGGRVLVAVADLEKWINDHKSTGPARIAQGVA
ncbi:MAG TPA: hypothetical protein VGG19_20675 [Tepidisphaeraceae bacterium]|jgi:hypothetical protein